MKKEFLSACEAAAHGAKLARVESVPNFESPLSAEIVKRLGKMSRECAIFDTESQDSAITAALGSEASGKRTFLPMSFPSSLQGMRQASSMRLPIVAANVSRSLALNAEHDILALRDLGWLMFFAENNQEILDSIAIAYRICEDSKVMLPSIVNIDFSAVCETVALPTEQSVDKFLPKLKLPAKLESSDMAYIDEYRESLMQQQAAMNNSLKVAQKACEQWKALTKRSYGMTESFMLDDAEYAFVAAGYHSSTAKEAVMELRQSEKVGMLRLRTIRPWPAEEISAALRDVKKIAVIDQNVSLGSSGILFSEIKPCCSSFANNFISFRYLRKKDFIDAFRKLKSLEKPERIWL